jgi:hypothetical protein
MSTFDDEGIFEEFLHELDSANIRMRFWLCPVPGHSAGTWSPTLTQTVEWRGDIAHCLAPGCDRTSADPPDYTQMSLSAPLMRGEYRDRGHRGRPGAQFQACCRECGQIVDTDSLNPIADHGCIPAPDPAEG